MKVVVKSSAGKYWASPGEGVVDSKEDAHKYSLDDKHLLRQTKLIADGGIKMRLQLVKE